MRYTYMYEVTCIGFDATSSDPKVNDRIVWVYASSMDVIKLALEDAKLKVREIFCMRGKFDQCDFNMSYEDEYEDFVNKVREYQS